MSKPSTPKMQAPNKSRRRRTRIIIIATLAGIALVAGGLVVTKKVVWPKYKAYQIKVLNNEAAELIAKNDPTNASLLVRKSLQKSQANPEAWRLGAAAAKARGLTEAIYYQNQLCKYDPSVTNKVELMTIAAKFDQYGLVLATGKDTAKDAGNNPQYHELMAQAYKKMGRPIAAKFHLEVLCNVRPGDTQAKLELAALELENDTAHRDKALRPRIRSLADQPSTRRQALSMLLKEAVNEKRPVDAQELLGRFEIIPDLSIEDSMLVVQATKLCRPINLTDRIERLEKTHGHDAKNVARIIDFLNSLNEANSVETWVVGMEAKISANEQVRRAVADSLAGREEWKKLTEWLQASRWETMEFLRHALLARSYKAQGMVTEYFENWKAATMEAGIDVKFCTELLQRLEKWRWDNERYDIIWKLFNMFPDNEQIRMQLYAWELKNRNTPNLNRMFVRMIEVDPSNPVAMSNFAYSSFLLNANLARAGLIAKQLYEQNPNDPFVITTYAFSLLRQGDLEGARKQMESLRASALSQPERMTLLAHILAKLGEYERATELISGINRNVILPEEKVLIERAEDEIARGTKNRALVSKVTAMRANALASGAPKDSGGWMTALQPETRAQATPAMQLTNTLYSAGDYSGMLELLRNDDWNENDYLRHALLAYCQRNTGSLVKATDTWHIAMDAARRNQLRLENVSALTAQWDWQEERTQALNALFETTPHNRVLLAELLDTQRARRKTSELTRLLGLYLADSNQRGDEAVAHAYYSLISGMDASRATVRAKECFESEPDNGDARLVHILSLHKQGRDSEADRLLAETRASSSELVSVPLIRALVQAGTGDNEAAARSITEIDRAKALPEEAMLADKLQAQLRAKKQGAK